MGFKIGDRVRVINRGKQYTTYIDFIKKYCPREKANKFEREYKCKEDVLALVIGSGKHLTRGGIPEIYILEYDNHVVIIEESGLERASETKSIHIYTNDLTTTAVIKENGKVIKSAVAKCNPSDTYDFETGARIAFDRLCNGLAKNSKFSKIKEFKPHLKSNYTGSEDGFIGEETVQVDLVGNKLCVGDTVTLYSGIEARGEYSICKDGHYPQGFVMGVGLLVFIDGKSLPYSIIKNRSYTEIPNGEIVGGIKYIKEEN